MLHLSFPDSHAEVPITSVAIFGDGSLRKLSHTRHLNARLYKLPPAYTSMEMATQSYESPHQELPLLGTALPNSINLL